MTLNIMTLSLKILFITAFSIRTLIRRVLSIRALSITTFSIGILIIRTIFIRILGIMTFSIRTLSIMAFSVINKTKHPTTMNLSIMAELCYADSRLLSVSLMLSVTYTEGHLS
jgi:hypothetical protein